jgi:hypothetical protein
LGYDRKTIRRYVRGARDVGLKRGEPFPDEQEMLGKLKELLERSALLRETPAKEILRGYRDEIEKLLAEKDMTVKQVKRLLAERHELNVSYSSVLRYVGEQFNLEKPEATVQLETEPGEEAQVDFGYVGLMRETARIQEGPPVNHSRFALERSFPRPFSFMRATLTCEDIPRHALKKIFDDFYRVDNDLTRTTKGTGIGLALVKRFVETMGGRVSAANNDGPGCTITLAFPGAHPSPSSGS